MQVFKTTVILPGLVLTVYSVAMVKEILAPFSFAIIIAIFAQSIGKSISTKRCGKIFASFFQY
jgi:hypothetical protein